METIADQDALLGKVLNLAVVRIAVAARVVVLGADTMAVGGTYYKL
jgi:hypothetical protein